MLEQLLGSLSQAVTGTPLIALTAAAGWGLLSILLSPCHLGSIPLIVGVINGQGEISGSRAFTLSSLFAIGILFSIALIGALTAMAGRMIGDLGSWGNWLEAGIFFLFGLHLLGFLPMPGLGRPQVGTKQHGLLAALLLGLLFGIALGPCTFAFMGPVLSVAFNVASANLAYAAGLLLAYGVGHCAVIVLAGTFTKKVQQYLHWNERSQGATRLRQGCGLLVIAAGGWLIYAAP